MPGPCPTGSRGTVRSRARDPRQVHVRRDGRVEQTRLVRRDGAIRHRPTQRPGVHDAPNPPRVVGGVVDVDAPILARGDEDVARSRESAAVRARAERVDELRVSARHVPRADGRVGDARARQFRRSVHGERVFIGAAVAQLAAASRDAPFSISNEFGGDGGRRDAPELRGQVGVGRLDGPRVDVVRSDARERVHRRRRRPGTHEPAAGPPPVHAQQRATMGLPRSSSRRFARRRRVRRRRFLHLDAARVPQRALDRAPVGPGVEQRVVEGDAERSSPEGPVRRVVAPRGVVVIPGRIVWRRRIAVGAGTRVGGWGGVPPRGVTHERARRVADQAPERLHPPRTLDLAAPEVRLGL